MSISINPEEVSLEECNRCYAFLQTPTGEEFLQTCYEERQERRRRRQRGLGRPIAKKISKLSDLMKDSEWEAHKQEFFYHYMQNRSSTGILRAMNDAGHSFSTQSPRTCDNRLESWGFPLNRHHRKSLVARLRSKVASQDPSHLDVDRLDGPSSLSDHSQHVFSIHSHQLPSRSNSKGDQSSSLDGTSVTCYNLPDSPTLGATQDMTNPTNQIESLEISPSNFWWAPKSNWCLPIPGSQISYLDLNIERSTAPTALVDLLADGQLHLPDPSHHTFNNAPSLSSRLGGNMLIQSTDLVRTSIQSVSKGGLSTASDADSGFYSMNVVECNSFHEQDLGNLEDGGDMSYFGSNLDIGGELSSISPVLNVDEDQHPNSNTSDATDCIASGTLQEIGLSKTLSILHRIRCDKDHRNIALGLSGVCDCGITKVHAICIWAASLPHYEAVRRLANISNKDELDGVGNTSLHYLAAAGSKKLLEYMINFGVDVKRLNTFGQNFLHVLDGSGFGNGLVEFLAGVGCDGLLNQRDHNGRTVLQGLLRYPIDLSVCRELITFYGPEGAFQFALRDNQGRNAAYYLDLAQQRYPYASYDYFEYIETTLYFKNTARSFVIGEELPDDAIQRELPDKDEGWEALHMAVLNKASSEPNSENWSGNNALHCLAFWPAGRSPDVGRFRVSHLEQYISCGVDLNGYNQAGRTPLLAHLHESHPEDDESATLSIVKLLVQNGASVHFRDRDGHTALYHAIVRGFSGCVSFLLQNGACANSRAKDGRSLRKIAQGALQLLLVADDQTGSDKLQRHLEIMQALIAFSAVLEPTQRQEWGLSR